MEEIRVSVRNLVEFLLAEGDIDEGKGGAMRMEAIPNLIGNGSMEPGIILMQAAGWSQAGRKSAKNGIIFMAAARWLQIHILEVIM